MKINLDDPNLTAFALGELSGAERDAMEQAVASSAEAREFVAETQQLSRLLHSEYEAEQHPTPERSPNIIRMEEQRRLWSSTQWGSLAAALAIFAVIGVVAFSTIQRSSISLAKSPEDAKNERAFAQQDYSTIFETIPEVPTETQPATTPAQQNLLAMQEPRHRRCSEMPEFSEERLKADTEPES